MKDGVFVKLHAGERALVREGAKAAGLSPTELARKAIIGVSAALAPNAPLAADIRDSDAIVLGGVFHSGLHGGALGLIGQPPAADGPQSPLELLGRA